MRNLTPFQSLPKESSSLVLLPEKFAATRYSSFSLSASSPHHSSSYYLPTFYLHLLRMLGAIGVLTRRLPCCKRDANELTILTKWGNSLCCLLTRVTTRLPSKNSGWAQVQVSLNGCDIMGLNHPFSVLLRLSFCNVGNYLQPSLSPNRNHISKGAVHRKLNS